MSVVGSELDKYSVSYKWEFISSRVLASVSATLENFRVISPTAEFNLDMAFAQSVVVLPRDTYHYCTSMMWDVIEMMRRVEVGE